MNVNCLEEDDLSPFYKLYKVSTQDSETQIVPEETSLHWSLVEKVVLAQPEPKRSLGDVQTALEIMQAELQEMVAYLERDDAELEIVDQI